MAYIEGEARLNGLPRPGVRANLFFRSDNNIKQGARLDTDITTSNRGGLEIQKIFSNGRFYFGNLTTGNYIVYLYGGGFDGDKVPDHRIPFDIVDDSPVPANTLLLSGGTLVVYGTSSATTLSYITNLNSQPTDLATINAAEGAKLSGIETGATSGATLGVNVLAEDGLTVLGDVDVITSEGVAASITGQGDLATLSSVSLSDSNVTDKLAANITYADLSTVESLKPSEAGSQINSIRQVWSQTTSGSSTGYTSHKTTNVAWQPIPGCRFSYVKGRGDVVVRFAIPAFSDEGGPIDGYQIKLDLFDQLTTGLTLYSATSSTLTNNSAEIVTGVTSSIVNVSYPEGSIFDGYLSFKRVDNGGAGEVNVWGGVVYEQR